MTIKMFSEMKGKEDRVRLAKNKIEKNVIKKLKHDISAEEPLTKIVFDITALYQNSVPTYTYRDLLDAVNIIVFKELNKNGHKFKISTAEFFECDIIVKVTST